MPFDWAHSRPMSNSRVQHVEFQGHRPPARSGEIRQAVRSFVEELPIKGGMSYDVAFVWSNEVLGDLWFWSLKVMPRYGSIQVPPKFIEELVEQLRGLFEGELRVA